MREKKKPVLKGATFKTQRWRAGLVIRKNEREFLGGAVG